MGLEFKWRGKKRKGCGVVMSDDIVQAFRRTPGGQECGYCKSIQQTGGEREREEWGVKQRTMTMNGKRKVDSIRRTSSEVKMVECVGVLFEVCVWG